MNYESKCRHHNLEVKRQRRHQECLESLKHITYLNYEILLVVNDSSDGLMECFKELYPRMKIVESKDYQGFTEVNNVEIRSAMEKKNMIYRLKSSWWSNFGVANANNNYSNHSQIEDWMQAEKLNDANSVESFFWLFNILKNTKGNYSNLENSYEYR